MDFFEVVTTRRSVRSYNGKPVPDDAVDKVLRAGMYAPSAHNRQPWRFVVVRERQALNAIMQAHPYSKALAEAPMCIVVCYDEAAGSKVPGVDCAAATENMLLCARSLGLASLWLSAYGFPHQDTVGSVIGLPEGVKVASLVVLGYSDAQPPQPDRYDPSVIHYDRW